MISTWVLVFICALALGAERKFVGRLPRQSRARPSLHIYNGNKTSISNYPYLASLEQAGDLFGAAIILNDNWLLTTAFSVFFVTVDELSFRVGSSLYDKKGQVLKASQIIIHPKYPGNGWDYDIAVVQTTKPIKFGKNVQPIQGLGKKKLKAGTKGVTAGWGAYDSNYTIPENLLDAQVTAYSWKKCKQVYGEYLTKRLMCTFDEEVVGCVASQASRGDTGLLKAEHIKYDFGDPLMVDGLLYGMFAGGYDCNPGGDPVLYTDVTSLYKWVNKTISATKIA